MKKLCLILLFGLAACVQTPEEMAMEDTRHCESYDYKQGTQAFADCRLKMQQMRVHQAGALSNALNGMDTDDRLQRLEQQQFYDGLSKASQRNY